MARTILIVNATQVVTSEQNPQGLLSAISGYPKTFDSNLAPYNGDIEMAMKAAKAEYYSRLAANYTGSASRVMAVVTLETANGQQILRESIGAIPDMTPEPDGDNV